MPRDGAEDRATPLWRVRAAARAPRAVVLSVCGVLGLVGLKTLFTPSDPPPATPAPSAQADVVAAAFAESFARAYLTWEAGGSDRRDEALARLMPRDDAASADDVGRRHQRVLWSLVTADRPVGAYRRIVTVAAHTTAGLVHLAVPVARNDRGFLYVPSPPALVGPPATATDVAVPAEREVRDPELRTVAGRVVTNYLAREREDLRADLDADAVVSLPDEPMRVDGVDGVTWVAPDRRVAVAVSAAGPRGLRLALRYELSVTRRAGRWLVRTVHVNPTARESTG